MPENNGYLLPVYVLADESDSMTPVMKDLNDGLSALHAALLDEPMAAAKVRFSILGFSDDVQVRMEMADLRREARLPQLVSRRLTNYAAAFADLSNRIPGDVTRLKAQGYAVHRPAVFFLSDGLPNTGDWKREHAQLTDRSILPAAPNIVTFGVGNADPSTILAVATSPDYAFVALGEVNMVSAIATFCAALTRSIVRSGQSVGTSHPELVVERPQSFTMAIDVI